MIAVIPIQRYKILSGTDADDIFYIEPYVFVMYLAAVILDNEHTKKNLILLPITIIENTQ